MQLAVRETVADDDKVLLGLTLFSVRDMFAVVEWDTAYEGDVVVEAVRDSEGTLERELVKETPDDMLAVLDLVTMDAVASAVALVESVALFVADNVVLAVCTPVLLTD